MTNTNTFSSRMLEPAATAIMRDIPYVVIITMKDIPVIGRIALTAVRHFRRSYTFIAERTNIISRSFPIFPILNPQNVSGVELRSDLVKMASVSARRGISVRAARAGSSLTSE